MPVPSLLVSHSSAATVEADVLVIAVSQGPDGPVIMGVGELFAELERALPAIGVTGARDEVRRIPASGIAARSIALVGLGTSRAEPGEDRTADEDSLRYAAGTATRVIRGAETVALALPITTDAELAAVLEGAAAGAYSFDEYRSGDPTSRPRPASHIIVLASPGFSDATALRRASVAATALATVRDLVNMPPSDLFPQSLTDRALVLVEGLPITAQVFAEDALLDGGFGGILGVGQGSSRGPRLVKLSYSPAGGHAHLALVGKGITFDTGGLSLKPAASMVGMKYDMTGAATALAVIVAAATLDLPVRLTAWLCLAENMPSSTAIRPNDVLRMRSGTTVEVLNTDAEGRLVLADGLAAASEEHPDAIIDIATLTGAASVAMGPRYVATMGDAELVGRMVAAGARTGEPFWHMPLPQELRSLLDSDVADLANVKIGNTAGGMLIAGLFLREFVGPISETDARRIPWVHLDIAGAAHNSGAGYGFVGKGPTGTSVRALLELAEEFSRG